MQLPVSTKRQQAALFLPALLILLLFACNNDDNSSMKEKPGVVEVISTGMNFSLPDTLKSGWTTFVYNNQSEDTHFFVLEKYPAGKTIEDGKKEVIPVFSKAMDAIFLGKTDSGMAAFADLPAWYRDVQFMGGAGLTAPGTISQTMLLLEPGYYVMECYVKMANGKFHSAMGMTAAITAIAEGNGAGMPQASDQIVISSDSGIVYPAGLEEGEHVFAVHFKDQKLHENFVGQDLHLVRLSDSASAHELEAWMNWMNPQGLVSPAPDGITFLGGTQEMPAGSTAFFTADLSPGNYAFVSEVPDAAKKNMLQRFTIPAASSATD